MSTPDDPQDKGDIPAPRKGAVKLSTFDLQAAEVPAAGPARSHGKRSVVTALSGKVRPRDLMEETAKPPAAWRAKIVTLFPESFPGVLGLSLTGKALENGLWALDTIDLRPFGIGKHRNVDDTPAGGGAGMVLRADVVAAALDEAALGTPASREDWPVVYMSPRGKPFTQADARRFAAAQGMTILCGRFEGVDERVLEAYGVEEVSIGDFVLTGGELAAQVVIDATVRLREGVLGNAESATEESHSNGLLEHPQYTRPAVWQGRAIPEVLTSGNHKKIAQWRREMSEALTRDRRPDLWEKVGK
ncbi:tRNA (guanosine(37)-N1)-methyltransferase TrmD [Rhodobacter sp. TJ_12]|uniref:tRNA (guanosine(37)-N1)-methyltransferase TrmD n=1 Tax=Rhodobacter sp. TJ_12 TaxID=2029399 RepID=UPI001CBE2268|nr:tRNA (guanosine(37)-N1)-methyltransferase TrmD [Rhodobacter sp. TJ_12]MBZ4021043.1 tRNA (guanosine(37)-N1)-methyltransferase TrmD [Rhodobacter sp. TJ_12]